MSWLGDNFDFEKFQLNDWWKELKRHPQRALIGAMDKTGTQVWNKILGTDYDPMVNYAGGPSGQTYNKADEAGIRTGPARGAHKVADTVATLWGIGGLMGSSAMGGGTTGGIGVDAGGAGAGGGSAGGFAGGFNPEGYTGPGTDAYGSAGGAGGGLNWGRMFNQVGRMGNNMAQQANSSQRRNEMLAELLREDGQNGGGTDVPGWAGGGYR